MKFQYKYFIYELRSIIIKIVTSMLKIEFWCEKLQVMVFGSYTILQLLLLDFCHCEQYIPLRVGLFACNVDG